MTLAEFGIIAEIISAIAVVATLAFLAFQIRHANNLAQMQTRAKMVEMVDGEMGRQIEDPELRALFSKPPPLPYEQVAKVYLSMVQIMRHREWEWYQVRSGAIAREDSEQVERECFEVAHIYLSYPRVALWWDKTGRHGFNADFVAALDLYCEGRPALRWDQSVMQVEEAFAAEIRAQVESAAKAAPPAAP